MKRVKGKEFRVTTLFGDESNIMKINWLTSLVLFLGLLSSLSLAAQSENDDLDCYPMMNPAVIDEMVEEVEAVLGLEEFQVALETHPTAERFVIHREEGSISIRPRGSAQDIRGIHQDENREIINRLRELLPQELVDDPLLKYQVSSDKTIRIGTDSLSATRLHKIFEKVDAKYSANPSVENRRLAEIIQTQEAAAQQIWNHEIAEVEQIIEQAKAAVSEVASPKNNNILERVEVAVAAMKAARDVIKCPAATTVTFRESQDVRKHSLNPSIKCAPMNHQDDLLNLDQRTDPPPTSHLSPSITISSAATTVTSRESQDVRKNSLKPSVECAPMNHQNVSNDAYSSSPQLPTSISYLPSPVAAAVSPTTIRPAATTVTSRESQDVRKNSLKPSVECAPMNHQNVSNGAYSSSSQLSSSISYLPSQGTQAEEKVDGAASFSKEIFRAADQAWWWQSKTWKHYKEATGAAKARANMMQKAAVDEAEAAEGLARTMYSPVVMTEAAEQMITKRSSVQVIWSSRIAQAEQALVQAQTEARETDQWQAIKAQRTLERAEVIVTAERAAFDAIMVQIKGERAFSSAQIAKTESAWTDAMNNAQAAKAMWNHMIATIKWLDHLPHPIVSGKARAWLLQEYKHAEVEETRWTQKIALANFKMASLKRDEALIAAENAFIAALADERTVEAVQTEVVWMKARDTARAAASAWEGAIYASKQLFSMVSREGKMRLAAEIEQAKVQKDKWSKQYASIDLIVLVAQAENSVKKANDCQVVAENYKTEEAW